MTPRKTGNTEIAELATQVKRGFDAVYDSLDSRFSEVNRRFDMLEARMAARFDVVDERFDRIEWKTKGIELDVKQLRLQLVGMHTRLDDMENK